MACTYTGRVIFPTNYGVPSRVDIAVQLGRLPRWAGATTVPWSVLHHLWCCWSYATADTLNSPHRTALLVAVLLHDADEIVTGDIPTTWKTDAGRALTAPLERRIWSTYASHLGLPLADAKEYVKGVDLLMARAEAWELAPPNALYAAGLEVDPEPELTQNAREYIRRCRLEFPRLEDHMHATGKLVGWFLGITRHLIGEERCHAIDAQTALTPIHYPEGHTAT